MKKLLLILFAYGILAFALIFLLTFFLIKPPLLLQEDLTSYKFIAGLHNYFRLFPAILLSGFLMACSVQWQHKTSNSRERFSQGMLIRFRNCIIVGIFLVLVIFLNREVFLLNTGNYLEEKKKAPYELDEAIYNARYFIQEEKYHLALQYAQKAVIISPESKEAKAVLKESSDFLELESGEGKFLKENFTDISKSQKPLRTEDSAYSPLVLVEKAKEAALQKSWFNAHYWASLAVEACDEKNTNREEAILLANKAWNELQHNEIYSNEDEKNYYLKKKAGYMALNSGDSLKAYYIYNSLLSLKNVNQTPDVKRFFELAREDVKSKYFFFDETEDMNRLANRHDIYFSLENEDKTKSVFYIRNSMDIKKDGGLVRYLEDFNMVRYRQDGSFMYSLSVPYAKVSALRSADIGGQKWKNVPYIILQSVDRNTEGLVCYPEYSFTEDDVQNIKDYAFALSQEEMQEFQSQNSLILPMDFNDFATISEASAGPDKMPLFALLSFLSKAEKYGFASETFYQSVVSRLMYPMFILVVILFLAAAGWNYRIEDKRSAFRFSWLFFLPLCTFVFFGIFELCKYIAGILNYVVVGLFGSGAIFVSAVIYIVILIFASIHFVSRKE